MSVLLMLCVVLSALVTPGQGARRWEPCTGKGVPRWELGGGPLRVRTASCPLSLGARVCSGGASSPPGGQGGEAEAEVEGTGVERPTGRGPVQSENPPPSEGFTSMYLWSVLGKRLAPVPGMRRPLAGRKPGEPQVCT